MKEKGLQPTGAHSKGHVEEVLHTNCITQLLLQLIQILKGDDSAYATTIYAKDSNTCRGWLELDVKSRGSPAHHAGVDEESGTLVPVSVSKSAHTTITQRMAAVENVLGRTGQTKHTAFERLQFVRGLQIECLSNLCQRRGMSLESPVSIFCSVIDPVSEMHLDGSAICCNGRIMEVGLGG